MNGPNIEAPADPGELLRRLRDPAALATVELRPPRSGLSYADSMGIWIDMYHSIQRLTRDTYLFLTDNAVGAAEEENLGHLAANLAGDVPPARVVPFLTCKHSMEYCLLYAKRAAARGFEALTVLGGDQSVGPPRCLPHAYQLRERIRAEVPQLDLGGWINPHGDPDEQVEYLARDDYTAEFALTQIVSHHSIGAVERTLETMARRGIDLPIVFGVFLYRSANPETLRRLGAFFPVPAEELMQEFAAGATPVEICARTLRALESLGANKVYLSNLGFRGVERRYADIMSARGA